ncbi:MAG: hypothetical protein ACD_62C00409G0002, partial [uncultured bacterium]
MSLPNLRALLSKIQKPSQYLGNEVNAVHKDFRSCAVRVVLVFPDAYEIGMSHMGLRILYAILNALPHVVAERCFSPLRDFEQLLREQKVPLFSLESKTPLSEFDIIGISIPHEMAYTNILAILDLAGIPLWQKERHAKHPLVLGGGVGCYNPEPLADFFDAFALGDGEDLIADVACLMSDWKRAHGIDMISQNSQPQSRATLFERLTTIEGIYVPHLFEPVYLPDGTISQIKHQKPGYEKIRKRIVSDLGQHAYPTSLVVPNARLVHDRVGLEIQRGCARGCRFCQAGFVERPVRQRDPQNVVCIADEAVRQTGMDEISLLSLSAGDYPGIVSLVKELNQIFLGKKISLSVPATRTETLTQELVQQVAKVRKTGFTIAPEAGSERLRRVINKGNLASDLFEACRNAFSQGYRLIKFYYMFGLPFEIEDDLQGIAREAEQALAIGRGFSNAVKINIGLSLLIPKPFTPFQWVSQMTTEDAKAKLSLIRRNLTSRAIQLKWPDFSSSMIEGLFARGDRRLGALLFEAYRLGCRFDQWQEHFDFAKWEAAIKTTGVDIGHYLYRERDENEIFPWEHLFEQLDKKFLWQEYQKAREESHTPDCTQTACQACGVCDFDKIRNRVVQSQKQEANVDRGSLVPQRVWI